MHNRHLQRQQYHDEQSFELERLSLQASPTLQYEDLIIKVELSTLKTESRVQRFQLACVSASPHYSRKGGVNI